MSIDEDDPHCPECGEPIGQTATYCMHCSADLTAAREQADSDDDGAWDQSESTESDSGMFGRSENDVSTDRRGPPAGEGSTAADEQLLDPDGMVDNTLTVIVGIAGGLVVGIVGTIVLGALTGSALALPFGVAVWLGSTAYLVRRRTVQEAVAKSGYAVAIVLLLIPVVAVSPFVTVEGGIGERGSLFFFLLVLVAVPAGIAAVVGFVAAKFVPDGTKSVG